LSRLPCQSLRPSYRKGDQSCRSTNTNAITATMFSIILPGRLPTNRQSVRNAGQNGSPNSSRPFRPRLAARGVSPARRERAPRQRAPPEAARLVEGRGSATPRRRSTPLRQAFDADCAGACFPELQIPTAAKSFSGRECDCQSLRERHDQTVVMRKRGCFPRPFPCAVRGFCRRCGRASQRRPGPVR
jgi:hypothetical protein